MQESQADYQRRLKWFQEARYGLFIHWSLYTLLGRGTWSMHHDQIPVREIEALANDFNPQKFDARKWAQITKDAGMKYAVLTTRHHEGFCLWDSKVSDFTSVKTAAKRDFVAEYVQAFRDAGIRVGFYYSLLDWRYPGYFEPEKYPENKEALVNMAHAQVRELLSNYGKIDVLWFDGQWFARQDDWSRERLMKHWRTQELLQMIRELQPEIVINDRSGSAGDYDSPEQRLPHKYPDRPWELCETIGDYWQSWCNQRYTPCPIRKSVGQLILRLMTCARNGGNMLLNVGPDEHGEFPREDVDRLLGVGKWLEDFGESIYGCQASPLYGTSVGDWGQKGNVGYLFLSCWAKDELIACRIDGKPLSAVLMKANTELDIDYNPKTGKMRLRGLPKEPPHPDINVVKVTFESPPKRMEYDDWSFWLTE